MAADTTGPVAEDAPTSDGLMRALLVLEALAGMEQPATLPAIASAMGMTKSKAYRALRLLQDQGFVEHTGRTGYRLGSRSVALAFLIGPRLAFLGAVRPILHRLATVSSTSASLHLRSGAHRVLVTGVEAYDPHLRGALKLGERAPLTTGCSGTSILAHLSAAEAEQVIRSRPRRELRPDRALLARIRRDGYAMSFSANHAEVNGIAAPVLDPDDDSPLGSLALAGPAAQLSEQQLRRLSGPLVSACHELAPRLARMLGPHAFGRLAALDVTIQNFLE